MSIESPEPLTPEEENEKRASRAVSDAELIEIRRGKRLDLISGGAVFDGERLELTAEQIGKIQFRNVEEYARNTEREIQTYEETFVAFKKLAEGRRSGDSDVMEVYSQIPSLPELHKDEPSDLYFNMYGFSDVINGPLSDMIDKYNDASTSDELTYEEMESDLSYIKSESEATLNFLHRMSEIVDRYGGG